MAPTQHTETPASTDAEETVDERPPAGPFVAVRPQLSGSHSATADTSHITNRDKRYEDCGCIGRGGTASVHRVVDRDLLREVAIKLLLPEATGDEPRVRGFVKEAQVTAQLEHPNIPPVHELSATDEPYFTMKLVQGRTLTERAADLPPDGDLSARLRELLPIFLKVCDAVAYAHSRGVIHRDVKPDNIMVGAFGEVYLMDWGLARLLGRAVEGSTAVAIHADLALAERDQRRHIAGTPAFLAPEQAQGRVKDLDERTDVWNLGGVLYFILTARAPYGGTGLREALRRASVGLFTPIEETGLQGAPPALCRIIEKAMALRPADRYASALEVKAEVERFLRGGLHLPMRTYGAGERIVVEGELGDAAFIIARGRCIVYHTVDGRRRVVRELGPGEVFGEMGMIASAPRSATVEALEPVTVTVVTRALIEEAFGYESWMGALLLTLVERFRDVDAQLRAHLDPQAESR